MQDKPSHTRRSRSRFAVPSAVLGLMIIAASAGVAVADVAASDRSLGFFTEQALRISTRAGWLIGVLFLLPLLIELLGGFSYEIVKRLRPR